MNRQPGKSRQGQARTRSGHMAALHTIQTLKLEPRINATASLSPLTHIRPRMPQRQFRMPGKKVVRTEQADEARPKREQPEMDRYLLQVDRQTKRSFKTAEAAGSAALEIKTRFPALQVSIPPANRRIVGFCLRQSPRRDGLPQETILQHKLPFPPYKRTAAGTTGYLAIIRLRPSLDFDHLIERAERAGISGWDDRSLDLSGRGPARDSASVPVTHEGARLPELKEAKV